jgi:ribose transport system permease protein
LIGPFAALVIVYGLAGLVTPRFFEAGNFVNIALQVSIVSITAIGSTLVILTGGIDLSPGAALSLLTVLFATLVKFGGVNIAAAATAILLLGALLGALNGFLTAYVRIPSFITTLAALSAFRGIAFMFNKGSPVFSVSSALDPLFYGTVGGMPLPLFYVVLLYAGVMLLMRYTRLGREIYATGGNPVAAHLCGINVRFVQMIAFILAGAATAVGALLMVARLDSGSPNYGVGLELQAIAAAVIGGTSLSGGRGNVGATLLGSLIIVIVQNALNMNAVPTSLQNVITGLIILVAVGIDMWRPEIGMMLPHLGSAALRPTPEAGGLTEVAVGVRPGAETATRTPEDDALPH